MQPVTQEDNHNDGQEEHNQEHKMMTRAMARKRQLGTQEQNHNDGQEEATKNTIGGSWPWQWPKGAQP
jgi:hypothetical protein